MRMLSRSDFPYTVFVSIVGARRTLYSVFASAESKPAETATAQIWAWIPSVMHGALIALIVQAYWALAPLQRYHVIGIHFRAFAFATASRARLRPREFRASRAVRFRSCENAKIAPSRLDTLSINFKPNAFSAMKTRPSDT